VVFDGLPVHHLLENVLLTKDKKKYLNMPINLNKQSIHQHPPFSFYSVAQFLLNRTVDTLSREEK
jgi:hypothetical protein